MRLNDTITQQLQINGESLKNIIFDLGNVLIDINLQKTIDAFSALGLNDFKQLYSFEVQTNLFLEFEMGNVSTNDFRKHLKKYLHPKVTDRQLDNAWNAMLGDFPIERVELLKKLRQKYRLFVLSNTNAIHVSAFVNSVEKLYGIGFFNDRFEKIYFSNEIHLRKPNTEIYEYLIRDAGIVPDQTLFIDDLQKNIDGAQLAGLKVYHLANQQITDIFI